jgi:hypothetical protein
LSHPLGILRVDEAAGRTDLIRVWIRKLYKQEGNSKFVPFHTTKAQRGSKGMAPLINLGTRRG